VLQWAHIDSTRAVCEARPAAVSQQLLHDN